MAKSLRVGVLTPTERLDPKAPQHESLLVLQQVLEAPYAFASGGVELEPLLFEGALERVGHSEPAVYRAQVREGIVFSDGLPMGAHHLAANLRQARLIRDQAHVGVEERVISFTLKRPNARFDLSLSHFQCSVYRQRPGGVLGTGPFALADDSRPERVRLVRNPYARRPPPLDEIVFQCYPPDRDGQPSALFAALERGEVDVTTVLPRDARKLDGLRRSVLPGLSTGILYLNGASPRLGDARVRRALAQAVDRNALAAEAFGNALVFAAHSLLPRGLTVTPVRDDLRFDLVRAKALLAQPGLSVPRRLSVLVTWAPRPYLPDPRAAAERLRAQIAELGITLEIQPAANLAEFLAQEAAGKHDLVLSGWTADTLDPCDFLEANLDSSRIPGSGPADDSANVGRLRSPAVDRALQAYRAERKHAQLEELMHLASEEAPLVPLQYGAISLLHAFRVVHVRPSALAQLDLTATDLLGR